MTDQGPHADRERSGQFWQAHILGEVFQQPVLRLSNHSVAMHGFHLERQVGQLSRLASINQHGLGRQCGRICATKMFDHAHCLQQVRSRGTSTPEAIFLCDHRSQLQVDARVALSK
ncbi:hypothetical protein D3C84_964730 [compost metagenome]